MAVLARARKTDGQAVLQAAQESKGTTQRTEKGISNSAEVIVPVGSTHLHILKHGQRQKKLYCMAYAYQHTLEEHHDT